MLKRILCALLAVCAVTAFAACGKDSTEQPADDTAAAETADTAAVYTEPVTEDTMVQIPLTTPKGFTSVEYEGSFADENVKIKDISVARIGASYVFNVIYATVKEGRYVVETKNDILLFAKTGSIEQDANGSVLQFDIPADKLDQAEDETVELRFLLLNQPDMYAYTADLKIPDILEGIENSGSAVKADLYYEFNPYTGNNNEITSVYANPAEGGYKISIVYSFDKDRKLNINYPADENSIDISLDPNAFESVKTGEAQVPGSRDPLITGKGVYSFDYPAEKLVNTDGSRINNMIIRFYNPDNAFEGDTLDIDLGALIRLD